MVIVALIGTKFEESILKQSILKWRLVKVPTYQHLGEGWYLFPNLLGSFFCEWGGLDRPSRLWHMTCKY